MSSVFIQSGLILLREGLEAMLVIAALAAYLRKAGASHKVPFLYAGAGVAIVCSLIAAWIFETFNNGAHNDLLEGCIILLAAALMLYVSGWLAIRQDPASWKAELKQQAERALSRNADWAIALLAFMAVFREGAETVIFIHTLAVTDGGWTVSLIGGLVAAAIVLAGLYFAIDRLAQRLPLRPLFIATSAFLFVMAVKFVGEGIQEFQEQLMIPYTPVDSASWLSSLGLNASWEALGAQALIILLAIASFWILARRRPAQAETASAAPSSGASAKA